jgi:transcription elongation factor
VLLNERINMIIRRAGAATEANKLLTGRLGAVERERDAVRALVGIERQRAADMTHVAEAARVEAATREMHIQRMRATTAAGAGSPGMGAGAWAGAGVGAAAGAAGDYGAQSYSYTATHTHTASHTSSSSSGAAHVASGHTPPSPPSGPAPAPPAKQAAEIDDELSLTL